MMEEIGQIATELVERGGKNGKECISSYRLAATALRAPKMAGAQFTSPRKQLLKI